MLTAWYQSAGSFWIIHLPSSRFPVSFPQASIFRMSRFYTVVVEMPLFQYRIQRTKLVLSLVLNFAEQNWCSSGNCFFFTSSSHRLSQWFPSVQILTCAGDVTLWLVNFESLRGRKPFTVGSVLQFLVSRISHLIPKNCVTFSSFLPSSIFVFTYSHSPDSREYFVIEAVYVPRAEFVKCLDVTTYLNIGWSSLILDCAKRIRRLSFQIRRLGQLGAK